MVMVTYRVGMVNRICMIDYSIGMHVVRICLRGGGAEV